MPSHSNIVFIWSKDLWSTHLGQAIGNDKFLLSMTSIIKVSNWSEMHSVCVLAELTLDNKKLSDFYGFEILCQLRADRRLKCPIAVCSFMPEPWLRKRFRILEFPQHHPFIRLPSSPETLTEKIQNAEVADEPRLNDIISSYCDPVGRLIRLITHGKGFRQITRNVGVIREGDSLWSSCTDDVALLRNYLMNKLLGNTIISLGNTLAANIEQAIRARNLESLLATKSIFDSLLSELARATGISIAH